MSECNERRRERQKKKKIKGKRKSDVSEGKIKVRATREGATYV